MDEKAQEAMVAENAKLQKELSELRAGQNEVLAFTAAATVLREAEIPFSDSILKRACANPVMKESKIDEDWLKGIVKDFSSGHTGKVTGAGGHTSESEKQTDEAVTKRLTEALRGSVPDAGLSYAVAGRA